MAEIGEKYRISSHHLAKVMNLLGRAGMVRAVRGAGGGYQFAGSMRRVTLLDVVQLFEDLGEHESDAGEPGEGTVEGGVLQEILGEIDDIVRATLGSITIATLLKMLARHRNMRSESVRNPRASDRTRARKTGERQPRGVALRTDGAAT